MAESRPEFTRPSVGDELILFKRALRTQPEQRVPVRVTEVARFRITLEGIEGEKLPWWNQEYDIRSQRIWNKRYDDSTWEIHTPETLAYKLKQKQVEAFMSEHGIRTYELRGALRKKVDADTLAFVNLLKEWIGEETI